MVMDQLIELGLRKKVIVQEEKKEDVIQTSEASTVNIEQSQIPLEENSML